MLNAAQDGRPEGSPAEGRAEPAPPPTGVLDALLHSFSAARATISSFLELLSLEGRRAGQALVWMLLFAGIAVACVAAAWLGVMAILAMWAMSLGLSPLAAVSLVSAMNLMAAAALIYASAGMSRHLLFSATRRRLAGKPPVQPPLS